ncbi:MAG: hypothetical protein AAGA77_14870 [Bacteroidota bacterium]
MNRHEKTKVKYASKAKLEKSDQLDLVCTNCGADIDGANININSSLAKCGACNTVFSLKDDHFFHHDRKGRPEMIMPEGTDVLELSESLDIRLDWLQSHPRGALGFLTFFAIMWNGILALAVGGALFSGAFSAIAFMSIHLLVGLGLIYYLSTVYLNYTDIVVTSSYIDISHRPVKNPFIPSKRIDASDIDQLYVTKYVSSRTNGNPNYAFALYAILKTNGKKINLIKGMNRETQLYLEQEIERFLNIKDRPVTDSIVS